MPKFSSFLQKTRARRKYLRKKMESAVDPCCLEQDQNDCNDIPLLETSSIAGDEMDMNIKNKWDVSSISDASSTEHIDVSDSGSSTEDDTDTDDNDINCSAILNEKLYSSCRLSKEDSLALVSIMSSKFKLSKKGTTSLLKLIKLHLPKEITYPSSYYRYQKTLCFDDTWQRKVYFCSKCKSHLSEDHHCRICNTQYEERTLRSRGAFFIVCDVMRQLESVLSDARVCKVLSAKFGKTSCDTICDITDGEMYKSLSKGSFDLTFTFNTDGASCTNSHPPKSIWPFLLRINELPYRLRRQHVLLGGLWYDRSKPKMGMYLQPIVEYLNDLSQSDVTWRMANGSKVTSKIHFVLCAVDSPARCQMQGLKQYNGHYGCAWCYHPGKVIKTGNGHARIYPVQDFTPRLRTDFELKSSALNNKWEKGVNSLSPLVHLSQFDMCWGFGVDYMHCVLLGIVKQLTTLWFEPGRHPYSIGQHLKEVGNRFRSVKVPRETTRTPKILDCVPIKMKAAEWRTWLFVVPVLLKGILESSYLKHFGLLASSMHTLLTESITFADIVKAEMTLVRFASQVKELYGDENCTYNNHLLTHLPRCVLKWGPLFESSAFSFESCNGKLVNYIHSSKGVLNQIATHHFANVRSNCRELASSDNEVTKLFEDLQNMPAKRLKFALVKEVPVDLKSVPVIEQIRQFCNNPNAVFQSNKAFVNYHLYSSSECDTTKRSNSIIKVGNKLGVVKRFYKVQCHCKKACNCTKLFVLAKTFNVKSVVNLNYVLVSENSNQVTLEVIPLLKVELIKFFIVNRNQKIFYVSLPNLIEGDS